jgi:hypothetical protein
MRIKESRAKTITRAGGSEWLKQREAFFYIGKSPGADEEYKEQSKWEYQFI